MTEVHDPTSGSEAPQDRVDHAYELVHEAEIRSECDAASQRPRPVPAADRVVTELRCTASTFVDGVPVHGHCRPVTASVGAVQPPSRGGSEPQSRPGATSYRTVPEATVARLPRYLRALEELQVESVPTVSSETLAELAGVKATQVRKDLSHLGTLGTRGSGYDVASLVSRIAREIGLNRDWFVAIVGVGNLGRALALYSGLPGKGFRVVALIDSDPSKVGQLVGGIEVSPLSNLQEVVAASRASIGVVATPASSAQQGADMLVAAGVTAILNFAPASLVVPAGVDLRHVDVSTELQILAFYQSRRHALSDAAGAHVGIAEEFGSE